VAETRIRQFGGGYFSEIARDWTSWESYVIAVTSFVLSSAFWIAITGATGSLRKRR
jgi:hypothetical protein